MKLRTLPGSLVLVFFILLAAFSPQKTWAQQPGAPEQAAAEALNLFNDGKYKEAAESYEAILKNYPTSLVISEAEFRLGYLYYVLGDFDKSIENLTKILTPPAPPELQELGYGLIPQALAAKAGKQTDEAKRKEGFEAAIKEFDVFLSKFPNSDQVETVNYGRALACYQIAKYDDAVTTLRGSLQRFARSETILDTQYLLALTVATQANIAMQASAGAANPAADAKYDEAERLLRDIIAKKKDLALANDAQFQVGELLYNRGSFGQKELANQVYAKAIEAYRQVQPKEPMVAAQKERIKGVKLRQFEALKAKDIPGMKRMERLQEREIEKLTTLEAKADLTVSAKLKMGQILVQQRDFDAARVLFRQMEPFAEDEDQKKTISYNLALTYASQNLPEKAVAAYEAFKKVYKNDPMAENLPLLVGGLFLTGDPKTSDPAKALAFFKEGMENYPDGRLLEMTLAQQANALIQLKRFDEAVAAYGDLLKRNPKPETAVMAEFGIASVNKETNKLDEAIAGFNKVRTTYPETPQAEQAAFWVGQLALQKNDLPMAIAELDGFLKKYPTHSLCPMAMYSLAQAYNAKAENATAMELYAKLAKDYPKSEVAPYSYFGRANILSADAKVDEMVALMKEFIETYKDHPLIYTAYDIIGQSQINASKPQEAIATYSAMVANYPKDPKAPMALQQVVELWRDHATKQGRYLALNEEQRAEWNKGVNNSVAAAEKFLAEYSESAQLASALQVLLEDQKLMVTAKLKTAEELTKYFQDLAAKYAAKPDAQSKILFTLASFTYETDKAKALEQMNAAYKPTLVYTAAVTDLYGSALLEAGKLAESEAVYQKLAKDYPIPDGVSPDKAATDVQEAQATSLYGVGKVQQKQGKVAEASATFANLKQLYPWSPKLLEADYGIAQGLADQGKGAEASALLVQVIRAPSASADLRANAMLLLGNIQEGQNDIVGAINNYLKIAVFYQASSAAPEGLWKGALLLEKQAATLPEKLPKNAKPKDPTKPGQLAKALKAYKDIVANYPNSPRVEEAKARAALLAPPK